MNRKLLVALIAVLALGAFGCDAIRVRTTLARGNKLYKAQKYEEAIKEYQQILAIDPDNFLANYLVAISNLALYHPGSTHPKDVRYANDSLAAFEKCLSLKAPDDEWQAKIEKYYLSLLTSAGQEDRAVKYLEAELRRNPQDIRIMTQLATMYGKAGDFPKTLATFEKVAELEPKNKERWYTLGVVCWERSYKGGLAVADAEREQLIAKGHAALDKALALDADYFEALSYKNLLHREMAKVYANRQDLEAAAGEVRKAEALMQRALAARKKQQAAGGRT